MSTSLFKHIQKQCEAMWYMSAEEYTWHFFHYLEYHHNRMPEYISIDDCIDSLLAKASLYGVPMYTIYETMGELGQYIEDNYHQLRKDYDSLLNGIMVEYNMTDILVTIPNRHVIMIEVRPIWAKLISPYI